jgi:flagellar basal body rod protein FlgF
MHKICFFILIVVSFNVYANEDPLDEYNILYNDLINFDIFGYKSSWDISNSRGSEKINVSQGVLMRTWADTNFAIAGRGFFKIKLENDMIGYTRYGDFHMGFGDSESEFTLRTGRHGYQLYDPITIPRNTVTLRLERNVLYAFLPDDTKVEVGQVNIYEINEEKLIRYRESIFVTSDNYDSQIIVDSRIITGCVEMSNVLILETLLRMHIILWDLKHYGYNYDHIDQIILMLINNIPILNELSRLRMEFSNNQTPDRNFLTEFSGLNLLRNSINLLKLE